LTAKIQRIFAVGDPSLTLDWSPYIQHKTIHACRTWDQSIIRSEARKSDAFFLQEPPKEDWVDIVSQLEAHHLCVIRHALPAATTLQNVSHSIPEAHRQFLSKETAYGSIMLQLLQQNRAINPIALQRLCRVMREKGWHYVCDLCSYRDFGAPVYTDNPVEQGDIHAQLTGLLWRDSIFIRHQPEWTPGALCDEEMIWRVHSEQKVEEGYLYQSLEGFLLGIETSRSLLSYTTWTELREDHESRLQPLLHSCLLSFL